MKWTTLCTLVLAGPIFAFQPQAEPQAGDGPEGQAELQAEPQVEPEPMDQAEELAEPDDVPVTDDWGGVATDDEVLAFDDLTDFSLEALGGMEVEVTVVSRGGGDVRRTPAAVYVITGEEIRRSGHSSVQEALRMVPGFYVSRWTTNSWDVTARGFGNGISGINSAYLNQLLVMVDGAVVYTPLFAGVWWPLQDMDLGDIDRIEVVRGPAGVMWGSNAVHGIVHIITKHSKDTQGTRVYYRAGTRDHHAALRYGGQLGENATFRAWAKRGQYTANERPYLGFREGYTIMSTGIRADIEQASGREWTAWARAYDSNQDQVAFDLTTFEPYVDESPKWGQTVFVKTQAPDDGGVWQAWFQRDRQDIQTFADIAIDVLDIEYHKDFELSETNTLSLGVGFRNIHSHLRGDDPFYLDYSPRKVTQNSGRAFVYDTMRLNDGALELSFGLQAEYNAFTEIELQPTLRTSWAASENGVLWAGVTRAVRTPSIEERTLTPLSFTTGSPDFDAEELLAYELGYRHQFGEDTSLDAALFYNEYDNQALELFNEDTFEWELTNESSGDAYGGEVAIDFRVDEDWHIRSAYAYLVSTFVRDTDGTRLLTGEFSPKHLFNIRSYHDIGNDWTFDMGLYAVEGMGEILETAEYWRSDARLGYRPAEGIELAVGVQSATDDLRSEYDEWDNIRRAFYVSFTIER